MSTALAVASSPPVTHAPRDALHTLANLTLSGLTSPNTKRAYKRCIEHYLKSLEVPFIPQVNAYVCVDSTSEDSDYHPVTRESVQRHISSLHTSGCGAVSINVALSAIKLFVREAHARTLIDDITLMSIERIKGRRVQGQRLGNWIDVEQVKLLLAHAGDSANGVRDKALVAVLVGCALRREELVQLQWSQLQMRGGRWVLVDVVGKGAKVRSVPVPRWVVDVLEQWRGKQQ